MEREDTALDLSLDGRGNERMLTARLSDGDSGGGVSEREIHFFADGEPIGQAHTDEAGEASVALPPQYRGSNRTYEATFEGDSHYLPARGAAGRLPAEDNLLL